LEQEQNLTLELQLVSQYHCLVLLALEQNRFLAPQLGMQYLRRTLMAEELHRCPQ
jgi:hypothetical protein